MKKQQKLEHRKSESITRSERFQYRLVKDKSANGLPLTKDMQKWYGAKGAKFMSDIRAMKFTPGKQVMVSENKSTKAKEGNWGPYRKGVVVGDYPLFVQINHETSWNNVCYLKKDILIGKVRIERQGYEDNIC